ncbi:hypothetical protein N7535_009539 [Penicillium sp. DV-2018c]|nr:hypothetical protein N7461_002021 [Penicillium sp. DV-2018c]KAJ5559311.1 hypothetical protein N7535_009539 [Penicillium sp. DV-2018c]
MPSLQAPIRQALKATSVTLPQTWHCATGTASGYLGTQSVTVATRTDCITYVVSFKEAASTFTQFGRSAPSRLVNKKSPIVRHDSGAAHAQPRCCNCSEQTLRLTAIIMTALQILRPDCTKWRHVPARAQKGRIGVQHIGSLARKVDRPPVSSLWKAVTIPIAR